MTNAEATPLLEMRDVRFAYPGSPPLLQGIRMHLGPGERIGLVGGNGCGKSTLLHLLVGLLKPSQGTVMAFSKARITEADFVEVRRRVGLVFQHPDDQLFCPTVLDDVAFGPLNLGMSPDDARAAAQHALASVGLAGFSDRVTYKLSGGEKRGVAIATVLAMNPEVLLLDEPTSGLDADSVERLCEILRSLPQSMILVSHDHSMIHSLATRCVTLTDGRIEPLDIAGAFTPSK